VNVGLSIKYAVDGNVEKVHGGVLHINHPTPLFYSLEFEIEFVDWDVGRQVT
jgi:hypothetical protein